MNLALALAWRLAAVAAFATCILGIHRARPWARWIGLAAIVGLDAYIDDLSKLKDPAAVKALALRQPWIRVAIPKFQACGAPPHWGGARRAAQTVGTRTARRNLPATRITAVAASSLA